MKECKVVAEVGCTHLKKMDRAKMLIELAALAKADYVKFQKRNPYECVPLEMQNKPHPNGLYSYGKTYLEHRLNLELNIEQHAELKEHCEKCSIGYSTSVWDVTSAREAIGLNPDYIKVPSACNSNFEMLDILFNEYSGGVHISTGMTLPEEKVKLYEKLNEYRHRVVVYHCTSEYPCDFDRLYLKEIETLKSVFDVVGFSDHGPGIVCPVVGYVMGATWIEKHFVDDRTLLHSDAAASLEFDGLRKLCRDVKSVQRAMKYKNIQITEKEAEQRKKLRTSIFS